MKNVNMIKYSSIENAVLTSIVILRSGGGNPLERLLYKTYDRSRPDTVDILVVDDGSVPEDGLKIQTICVECDFSYVRLGTESLPFSPGRARNAGAAYARSQYIMHEDIDLMAYDGFYNSILDEINANNICSNCNDFLSVPVAYLNENNTDLFISMDLSARKNHFLNFLILDQERAFDFFMPASSVIILHRSHYLSVGGYNESFVKWGLEDLEFAYRVTRLAKKFHTPHNFIRLINNTTFSRQFEYVGWRNQFRLHGEILFRKGILLFHAHHQRNASWKNRKSHNENMDKFETCLNKFEKESHYLPVIPDPYKGKTLMFGQGCFAYNRALLPHFGEIEVRGYQYFDKHNFMDYINDNKITHVVFTNPYATEKRLNIYNIARNNNVPFFVIERGALRDSMYIDETGFCCESRKYAEENWNTPLSDEDRKKVLDYIDDETITDASLEKQSPLLGDKKTYEHLRIFQSKKVLFVPLQSRSDTTVKYFSGNIKSYNNFISLVQEVANLLPYDWVVVVKRHPLSLVDEKLDNVIFANDVNIKDLISISDYVLLMNSGVGVLSMLWKKPVIYTANAFYAHDKINAKAVTANDVMEIITKCYVPNEEYIYRFLYYLINQFYSFGKMTVEEKPYTDNAIMTVTTDIDYYRVFILGKLLYEHDACKSPIGYGSILYDPFRGYIALTGEKHINRGLPNKSQPFGAAFARKSMKLIANPRRFFLDSRHGILKKIGQILP